MLVVVAVVVGVRTIVMVAISLGVIVEIVVLIV
jgi:hypothetical protein